MKKCDLDIERLTKRISKSDESAFREFFDYYYPRLLNYAFVIIKNHESAEDIVLEVLHSVWERRSKIHQIEMLSTYLYICTRNKTLDYHKKNSRLINVGFDDPHYEEYMTHVNPEIRLINKELVDTIDRAILNLPEKTRMVYRLIKEEGMKYQEAAELLGVSVKTINNQLLSAMKEIRSCTTTYLNSGKQNSFLKALKSIALF